MTSYAYLYNATFTRNHVSCRRGHQELRKCCSICSQPKSRYASSEMYDELAANHSVVAQLYH